MPIFMAPLASAFWRWLLILNTPLRLPISNKSKESGISPEAGVELTVNIAT
jgi:hypothetical protein